MNIQFLKEKTENEAFFEEKCSVKNGAQRAFWFLGETERRIKKKETDDYYKRFRTSFFLLGELFS